MHEQYNVILIELKVLYLGIQRAEDQRDQISKELGDIKIQFVDMKIKLKDSMAEISKLGKVLEKVEDLVKKNNMEVNANSRKLVELVQYATNPCTNCKGPTLCLDGQVVHITPRQGTKIRAPKDICSNDEYGQRKVFADDIGTVNTGYKLPYVFWSKSGAQYCKDLSRFVYKCK